MVSRLALLLILFGLTACTTPLEYEDTWLDSPLTQDPALTDLRARVSTRPGLTQADLARPVIIAVHGYTASSFEWGEFAEFAESRSNVLVSRVVLGGHGRNVEAFRASTWQDWGAPILEEYRALVAQGYRNISLAGSSTGGALIAEHTASGAFEGPVRPNMLFFIDAIVVPGDKFLTLAQALSLVLDNVPASSSPDEAPYWYTNRPTETLRELNTLISRVRNQLHRGIRLPEDTRAAIYQSSGDRVADPVSALYLYRGLEQTNKNRVHVEMQTSNLHVFTRLRGRDAALVRSADLQRQDRIFRELISRSNGRLTPTL